MSCITVCHELQNLSQIPDVMIVFRRRKNQSAFSIAGYEPVTSFRPVSSALSCCVPKRSPIDVAMYYLKLKCKRNILKIEIYFWCLYKYLQHETYLQKNSEHPNPFFLKKCLKNVEYFEMSAQNVHNVKNFIYIDNAIQIKG